MMISLSKRKLLFALLFFVTGALVTANPVRFLQESFSSITKETVVYSTVSNYEMDIYFPEGDTSTNRPVVVLAHGGGFVSGSKENPAIVRLASSFAKRGYVAACFNYSLADGFGSLFDSTAATGLVVKSVGDGKAAVRFMRQSVDKGNPFGIDPDRIIFGGVSAGGIIATHVGMLDQDDDLSPHLRELIASSGGVEGNRGNENYSSDVLAVFTLAGAVKSVSIIDKEDTPIICFHGLDDKTVPIDCDNVYKGITMGFDVVKVCGSESIYNKSQLVGLDCEFHTYEGRHSPWKVTDDGEPNDVFVEVENKIFAFLYGKL